MAVDPTYLQNWACFQDLSEEQRKAVAEFSAAKCFYSGHTLFRENEPGQFLYLLTKGEVEILYHIGEDQPVCVDQVAAGEILGCSALIPPHIHIDTTRSLTEVEVLAIDAKALYELMSKDCSLGFSIQQHFIRMLLDRIVDLRLDA
jgi:CRP-like cAMP-binding protein